MDNLEAFQELCDSQFMLWPGHKHRTVSEVELPNFEHSR